MKEKPTIIVIEEFREELDKAVNNVLRKYNLPMYIVNMIFTNMHNQITTLAQQEYTQTLMEYTKKEEEENVENKE